MINMCRNLQYVPAKPHMLSEANMSSTQCRQRSEFPLIPYFPCAILDVELVKSYLHRTFTASLPAIICCFFDSFSLNLYACF